MLTRIGAASLFRLEFKAALRHSTVDFEASDYPAMIRCHIPTVRFEAQLQKLRIPSGRFGISVADFPTNYSLKPLV